MNIKLLFLFLILIISISVLFYYTFSGGSENTYTNNLNINYPKESQNVKNVKNVKNEIKVEKKNTDDKAKLILYWANWCGICIRIKPNWEEAKKIIAAKYPNLEIIDVNCDDPSASKCFTYSNGEKANLDGVPTIILRKGTTDVEYKKDDQFKGNRSVDELVKFCDINI